MSTAVLETSALLSIEMTRVILAPRPRVFDAWTRPEMIRQWFAPQHAVTTGVETDPVVGGDYQISMRGTLPEAEAAQPSQSNKHVSSVRGTYTQIMPYDLLQFTWKGSWAEEISRVTLHFRDVDGGTEVRLIHDQIAPAGGVEGYNRGWTGAFNKLQQLLAS